MSTLLTPGRVAHHLARDNFDVFIGLAFSILEPTTKLSWGWYLDAMAGALADVERGDCRRLLITIPPRHMKSLIASVMFPAWVLGRDPSQKFICVSYSQDLATIHSRNFRRLIQSSFYKVVFPKTALSFNKTTDNDLQTQLGGYRLSTSVLGTVTGIGADYILIDDLMKANDTRSPEKRLTAKQFVSETLLSRLNDKVAGRIVSIQQRLHEDDIVAHFKEMGGFRELEFPATAVRDELIPLTRGRVYQRKVGDILNPEREPAHVLQNICREMGNRFYQAQYQQDPTLADGEYLDWSKIHFYEVAPLREQIKMVVQSWDTAASVGPNASYSACTTWGFDGEAWLLLDVVRARFLYPELRERARLERKRWQADTIIIENTMAGPSLIGDLSREAQDASLRRLPSCQVISIMPREGKQERMMGQVERLYEGFAKFPRGAKWLDDLKHEMHAFPEGTYDDQVDSISQFLNFAIRRWGLERFVDETVRRDIVRQPGKVMRPG